MIKARSIISLSIVFVLLVFGTSAMGAPQKGPSPGSSPGIKPEIVGSNIISIYDVPWGSPRGDGRSSGRSPFSGPSGNAVKVKEFNLVNMQYPTELLSDRTKWLLAGKGDMIFYTDKKSRTMRAVSTAGGELFSHPVRDVNVNSCYLASGGFYDINIDLTQIDYTDYSNNEIWNKHLKPAHYQRSEEIWCLGQRIYTSTYFEGKVTVQAWEKDSEFAWFMYPGNAWVTGIAEEPNKFTYVQTVEGLWQHDWGFTETWFIEHPPISEGGGAFDSYYGPIVGFDGRVWVNLPWSQQYKVYNQDGSLFTEGNYSEFHSNHIKGACAGNNGMFYVAGWYDVQGFSEWNNQVWHTEFEQNVRIADMVLDKNNRLYVLYYIHGPETFDSIWHWASLDPTDGHIIYQTNVNLPELFQVGCKGELAIGDKNRLILLLHTGYMAVFEPLPLELKKAVPKLNPGMGVQ